MPLRSLVKNTLYYLILGCGSLALVTYSGLSDVSISQQPLWFTGVVVCFWFATEVLNSYCHVYLRILRKAARTADWTGYSTIDTPKKTMNVKAGPFTLTLVYPANSDIAWATKHIANVNWPLPMAWPFTRAIAPNYGFEITGWLLMTALAPRLSLPIRNPWFSVLSFLPHLVCLVFAIIGACQMSKWA